MKVRVSGASETFSLKLAAGNINIKQTCLGRFRSNDSEWRRTMAYRAELVDEIVSLSLLDAAALVKVLEE